MTDEIYLKIQNYISGLEDLRKQVKKLEDKAYTLNKEIWIFRRSAPELLEALEDIIKFYSENIKIMPVAFQTFSDLAEQVINKAKGDL